MINLSRAGATLMCTVGPSQKLVPSDGQAIDYTASAVAVSGNVAVVGAPNAWRTSLTSMDPKGAGYVYRFNGMIWEQEQKLAASDAALGDRFGTSVAAAPGIILVGAPYDDDSIRGTDSGSVYVFRFNGTSWVQQAQKLLASDGAASDSFGNSVSLSADGNVALVGAVGKDEVALNAGAAYIFHFNGTSWVQEQKFLPVSTGYGDQFGMSVSVSGNFAVVGAMNDDTKGTDAGAAYVSRYNGSSWLPPVKLTASDGRAYQAFGYSVSVADGVALIGAYLDNDRGNMAGAAYVFRYNTTNQQWVQEAKLLDMTPQAPSSEVGNQLGWSVGIWGNTAIVGAPYWDDRSVQYPIRDQGAAYVYTYDSASLAWTVQTRLLASGAVGYYDNMGKAVAISGSTIIAGAYANDALAMDSGAAYVFNLTCANYHPADTDNTFRINISEATKYGSYWKNGQTWPTPPSPIPISYATSAGYIWKNGEFYHYDSIFTCPQCWVAGP